MGRLFILHYILNPCHYGPGVNLLMLQAQESECPCPSWASVKLTWASSYTQQKHSSECCGNVAMHSTSVSWAPVQTRGLSLPSSLGPELSRFWVCRTSVSHLPPPLLSQPIMSSFTPVCSLCSHWLAGINGVVGLHSSVFFFLFFLLLLLVFFLLPPSFCHRPLWLVLFSLWCTLYQPIRKVIGCQEMVFSWRQYVGTGGNPRKLLTLACLVDANRSEH